MDRVLAVLLRGFLMSCGPAFQRNVPGSLRLVLGSDGPFVTGGEMLANGLRWRLCSDPAKKADRGRKEVRTNSILSLVRWILCKDLECVPLLGVFVVCKKSVSNYRS